MVGTGAEDNSGDGAGYASGYLGLRTPTYDYKIGNFMKVARFLFEKTLSVPMYILNMLE